jgi:hypothetical protein
LLITPTVDINKKYNLASGTVSVGAAGRSGPCLDLSASGAAVSKVLENRDTWIIGAAYQITIYPGASGRRIYGFASSGISQLDLRINPGGYLYVTRAGTVLGTALTPYPSSVYKYLEFKSYLNSTSGSYEVRADGTTYLINSNINTSNKPYANAINLLNDINDGLDSVNRFCDIVMMDGSGTNNNFLGDVRVDYRAPAGNGYTDQFNRSNVSVQNYTLVNSGVIDSNNYVQTSGFGYRDYYTLEMQHTDATIIYGVQSICAARATDATATKVALALYTHDTNYLGSGVANSTSYSYYNSVYNINPYTNSPWTAGEVDALQIGFVANSGVGDFQDPGELLP